MSVQFLSEEWMGAVGEALRASDAFTGAINNVDLSIQFAVTGGDDDVRYYVKIADGAVEVASGDDEGADVTVTNDYETAAAISKGELNTQMAFMTGKLKVEGQMAKLMMHQNVVNQFSSALAGLDVEY